MLLQEVADQLANTPTITYNRDVVVYHTTGDRAAAIIRNTGFKTGGSLGIGEKRNAVFFSAKDVNPDLYARNKSGETHEGQQPAYVGVNIRDLCLLNLNYVEDGAYVNHKQYNSIVVRGDIDQIPGVDGAISYLDDGRIYEVCLPVDVANSRIVKS